MSFQVISEDLTAHASHLDGIVDRLRTAADAAKTASMSEDCYGLLCSFLPPIINPTEEKGMEAVKAAVEGVSITADNVRSTAAQYAETDTGNSKEFNRILDEPTPKFTRT